MKLTIIRHGQTDWNVAKKYQGISDIELNLEGELQSEKVAQILKDEKFNIIISSPLKRTLKTAQIINQFHQINIEINKGFIERDFGDLEGIEYKNVDFHKIRIDELYQKHKIEHIKDFEKRIKDALHNLLDKYHYKNVLLITHGGVSYMIISILENKDFYDVIKQYKKPPTSITTIEFDENKKHKFIEIGKEEHLI